MKTHPINLEDYRAKARGNSVLYLGTAGSYGNEQLEVTLGEGWAGLTVQVIFQPSGVAVQLPEDGLLEIPWEATEKPLTAIEGKIVFQGFNQERLVNTVDLAYTVETHSMAVGRDEKPYTPGIVESVLNKMNADKKEILSAARRAELAESGASASAADADETLGQIQEAVNRFEEAFIRPVVHGNPAVCSDSIAWRFQGLKVYGKCLQNGVPSLENPVPIVNAGEGGRIELTITGSNIFDPEIIFASQIKAGIVSVNDNGEVILHGTFNSVNRIFYVTLEPGIYYLSDASGAGVYRILAPSDSAFEGKLIVDHKTEFMCYIASGYYNNLVTFPMIELSESASQWEGHKELQQLVLMTASGMPGIPVDSGGNCTDADGKSYVSNYWDFGDGRQHLLCGEIASYNGEQITTSYISSTGALTVGAQVLYVLPKPQTQPIPAETMAAYRALTTYTGTTIIRTTEPVAEIEARYIMDGTAFADKVNAAGNQTFRTANTVQGG